MAWRDTANKFLAAAALPQLPPAKVKPKQQSLPGFKQRVDIYTSLLPKGERRLAQTDALTYRNGASTKDVIKDLASSSPDLSATVNAYLRVGIPNDYTVIGRTADGLIDRDSTQLAQEILRRVTYLSDPSLGYNSLGSLEELSASLAKELLYYGSSGLELVLDKTRSPTRLSPIHTPTISYYEDKELGYVRPVQRIGGTEIDLDLPTVFIYNLDQSLLSPYSESPLEPAIQSVLADTDFLNSLRRVMRRAIHPRLKAKVLIDKILETMPPEISNDEDKRQAYLNGVISEIETVVNGLSPEDALVSYDTVEYSNLGADGQADNVGATLKAVQDMLNSKLAAGAKTLPSVLGRGTGSGTASSIETMLFLKNANSVRVMLNTLYSRALTQAVRLYGKDVYVDFSYNELDMRPDTELEAYKAMKQSRLKELLSLGILSDDEFCVMLTGNLTPAGYVPKSGTMFMTAPAGAPANPSSQTSTMKDGQQTPAAPKGPAKSK
jgi:hypothetical protein